MIEITERMKRAVNELSDSGAAGYLIERMAITAIEEAMYSDSMREDRMYRARMENIKGFDSEIQIAINGMNDED